MSKSHSGSSNERYRGNNSRFLSCWIPSARILVLSVNFSSKLFAVVFVPLIYLVSCVLFNIIIISIIIVTYMLLHYGWLAFGRGSGWSVVYTVCARVKETEKSSNIIFFLSRGVFERGRASVPRIFHWFIHPTVDDENGINCTTYTVKR